MDGNCTMETGDPEINKRVKEWLEWDKNAKTRAEIEGLVQQHDVDALRHRLCHRMEFGTAGLRSKMGAGNSMMNDLTIIQTTQGFWKYIEKTSPDVKEHGVAIGHDARYNSKRFAALAATIFLNQNVPVYLFSEICPTPFVPFCVTKYGCDWGIMVTASHNPKDDNGYKVYYKTGAQIIPPHDKGIAEQIEKNLAPWPDSWNTEVVEGHTLRKDPYQAVFSSYMEGLHKLCNFKQLNMNTSLNFTYTAMHGVGYAAVQEAAKVFDFRPFIPVKEQVEPDPAFPTVVFPNPEEGRSALDLSIKTAEENNSTVILANDPDADRLALAEKQPSGSWKCFTGNETGTLLCWWMCFLQTMQNHRHKYSGKDVYTLASTVSSKILRSISVKEGFNFVETLTGFKWMGSKAYELIQQGKTVIFAFEEAIGFMCGNNVLDKDGVSAAVVCAEMATYLNDQGISIKQQLENIYDKYGYHYSLNSYFICHDPDVINNMFERLRNYSAEEKYPTSCGPYKIKYIRDLTTGYDNRQPDNKAILPVSPSSQMITFTFENGCEATLRTSGTEPKIKYYTEFCADPAKGQSRDDVRAELKKMVNCIIEEFFQPDKNKLIWRSQ